MGRSELVKGKAGGGEVKEGEEKDVNDERDDIFSRKK